MTSTLPSVVDEKPNDTKEVLLKPFELTLERLTFLKALASSFFVVSLVLIVLYMPGIELSQGTESPSALGADLAFVAAVLACLFFWLWSLVQVRRIAIAIFSCIVGLLVIVVPISIAGIVQATGIRFLTLFLGVLALLVVLDGVRPTPGLREPQVFVADPGSFGLRETLVTAFGIHPICAWLPRLWQRCLARTLFLLSTAARGFALVAVFYALFFVLYDTAETTAAQDSGRIHYLRIVAVVFVALSIGLAVVLRYAARRLCRISAATLIDQDRRPPVLFLRSFRDDQVRLPRHVDASNWLVGGSIDWVTAFLYPRQALRDLMALGEPRPTADNLVLDEATPLGPVIAIGVPGSPAPFGAARTYVDDAEWQDAIQRLALTARAIVIVLDETAGVRWEIEHIRDRKYAAKTLYLLPPRLTSPEASSIFIRGHSFSSRNQNNDSLENAPTYRLFTSCIGWYETPAGGKILLTTEKPTAASYDIALRLFQAYRDGGYLPFARDAAFVKIGTRIAARRDAVDAFFDTINGVVVSLKDGQVFAPVRGEYKLFATAKEYRDAAKDRESWSQIKDAGERGGPLLSHLRFEGE